MNTLLAHIIISVALLTAATLLLILSKDVAAHTIAVGIFPLLIGYWLQSPVQQVATQPIMAQLSTQPLPAVRAPGSGSI